MASPICLLNEIDASWFSGPEHCFACAPYIFLKTRFSRVNGAHLILSLRNVVNEGEIKRGWKRKERKEDRKRKRRERGKEYREDRARARAVIICRGVISKEDSKIAKFNMATYIYFRWLSSIAIDQGIGIGRCGGEKKRRSSSSRKYRSPRLYAGSAAKYGVHRSANQYWVCS